MTNLRDLQDIRDGQPDAPTWELFRAMGNSSSLSEEGLAATGWALDLFEDTLGRSWPIRQFRQQGWVPGFLLGYGTHRADLPRLLTTACQLDRFRDSLTLQPVLRQVKKSVSDSGWRHLLLQLEMARLGQALSASIRFEPPIEGTDRSGDIELVWDSERVIVETTSLSRADADRAHQRFESRMQRSLQRIAWQHAVAMEVSLSGHPVDRDDSSWLDAVDCAAATVARTGARFTDARGWARVVIMPAAHDGDLAPGVTTFTGAVHQRDSWQRVRTMLKDKARQSAGAPNAWIRMDALDGLFAFTDWARQDINARVDVMADAIRAALVEAEHVHGVILSSGASVNLDNPSEPLLHQRSTTASGTILRRLIGPGLLRETVIVSLTQSAAAVAARWVRAYDAEASHLVGDLAQHGWSLDRMRAHTSSH